MKLFLSIFISLLIITSCGAPPQISTQIPAPHAQIPSIQFENTEVANCYYWDKLIKTKNFIGKTICVFGVVNEVEYDRSYSFITFSYDLNQFRILAKGDYQHKVDYCMFGQIYINSINSGVTMPFNEEYTLSDCPPDLVEIAIDKISSDD